MSLSDYEPIKFDMANLDGTVGSMRMSQGVNMWAITAMSEQEDEEAPKA